VTQGTAICLDSRHGAGPMLRVLKLPSCPLPRVSDRGRTRAVTHSDFASLLFLILYKRVKPLILDDNMATDVRNFPLAVRTFPLTVRNFPCHPQLDYPSFPLNVRLQ
jgi:hypothetical protein